MSALWNLDYLFAPAANGCSPPILLKNLLDLGTFD